MSSNKDTTKKELKKVEEKSRLPLIVSLIVLIGVITISSVYYFRYSGKDGSDTSINETISAGNPQTPTEAYKKLFTALKSKDKPVIKEMMTKGSIGLAEMQAGKSKKDVDDVLANGFFTANFSDTLPAIRDERIKGRFGAIEVFSKQKGTWENVPFMIEDGAWKLAVGDIFSGTFESPGKPRTTIEKENANAAGKTDMVPYGNGNVNMNVKPKIIDPMKDGKIPAPKEGVDPTQKKP